MARYGTTVRIRGSSAKTARQHEVSIPVQRDARNPGNLGRQTVARRSAAVVEVAGPTTFPLMGLAFLRAWSYLRFVIQQARNPRWAGASCGAHARNLPAVRSGRQKFWPRCSGPGCDRPVPPDALHDLCGRAGPYVALIRAPRHGGPCCPGICSGCRACLDTPRVQAGWCARCSVCVACCRGHGVVAWPTIRQRVPVSGTVNQPRSDGHDPAHGNLGSAHPGPPDSAEHVVVCRYDTDEESLANPAEFGRFTIGRVIHHRHPDPLTPLSIPFWPDPPDPSPDRIAS